MSRNKLIGILVVSALLVSFSALVFRNVFLSRQLKVQSEKLFKEIERENTKIEKLYTSFSEVTGDLNEVRAKLYLPEKTYAFEVSKPSVVSSAAEKKNTDLPFFLATDRLLAFDRHLSNEKEMALFMRRHDISSLIKKYSLSVRKPGDGSYRLKKGNETYYTLYIASDKPLRLVLAAAAGQTIGKCTFSPEENAVAVIRTYLDKTVSSLHTYFQKKKAALVSFHALQRNKKLLFLVKKYKLRMSSGPDTSNREKEITTRDGRPLVTYGFDPETLTFSIGSEKYGNFDIFLSALLRTLENADKRTSSQIKIDNAKDRILKIAGENVFQKYLEERGLKLSTNEREDNDYYYFDFIGKNGEKKGALGVQKHIGTIYLFDPEDVVIASLKSLPYTSVSTKGPSFTIPASVASFTAPEPSPDSETLILIGSHEKNADTIILANLNKKRNRILLFSLPRDLYYKNRKINDYYRTYGGGKFSEIVADITGLKISGYIGIDMYAFIDVINILGGIDVDLKSSLTDPTYKVRDNGVWTTLHYDKGLHHFNGIEALRVARSRHTSSDFGRSDRQQLILQGVKDKLNRLNLANMNKIYSIFKTIDEYLDTDLSPVQMISLYLTYKNAKLEKKDGLSTFNVLYNTYSNIYALKDKSKQYEKGFYRGAWILLPRDNNWNVIKWYINKILQE